jgi:AmmeMemoRadiSam system protein B
VTPPRLRPLEVFPVEIDGRRLVCLRDPSGVGETLVVTHTAALIALLCDGTRDADALAAEIERHVDERVAPDDVRAFVAALDEAHLLDGERARARRAALEAEFRAAPRREAANAGGAYPDDPAELAAALDAWLAAAPSPARLSFVPGAPALLVAPHIDFARGGPTYARAYGALPAEPPDLVVVLGTDHDGGEPPFTLTRKPFATPLGDVPVDGALVDALAARLGDELFADEPHHRGEHSIELQAVWLRHLFGARTPPMLPVLCGAARLPADDARVAAFLSALRALTAGRRVLIVAAADLAHVGPRFGDDPIDAAGRREVEAADRAALDAVVAGDAEGFFAAVAATGDRFRVCGLAPITCALALRASPSGGTLLDYDQRPADEEGTSFVTICAVVVP